MLPFSLYVMVEDVVVLFEQTLLELSVDNHNKPLKS